MVNSFLLTFFREKNLTEQIYEVVSPDGTWHLIPSTVVIDSIHSAGEVEQKQIAAVLRKIDFANGDVHHFLKHLAGALAANY